MKAITVSAVGWSHQYSGVVNAMRLTQFFGQPDIPVGYSSVYAPGRRRIMSYLYTVRMICIVCVVET